MREAVKSVIPLAEKFQRRKFGYVRFARKSGHFAVHSPCPLSANSGHFAPKFHLLTLSL